MRQPATLSPRVRVPPSLSQSTRQGSALACAGRPGQQDSRDLRGPENTVGMRQSDDSVCQIDSDLPNTVSVVPCSAAFPSRSQPDDLPMPQPHDSSRPSHIRSADMAQTPVACRRSRSRSVPDQAQPDSDSTAQSLPNGVLPIEFAVALAPAVIPAHGPLRRPVSRMGAFTDCARIRWGRLRRSPSG